VVGIGEIHLDVVLGTRLPRAFLGKGVARGMPVGGGSRGMRSEEHTSELQSRGHLVCRLLLEKKKKKCNYPRWTYGVVWTRCTSAYARITFSKSLPPPTATGRALSSTKLTRFTSPSMPIRTFK